MMLKKISISLVLLLAIACSQPTTESGSGGVAKSSAEGSTVMAETRHGHITGTDIDRFFLERKQTASFDPKADKAEQFAAVARRLAVEQLLLKEATLVGADQDPAFRLVERRVRRTLLSDDYLSVLPSAEPITDEEIRRAFEDDLKSYQREETRNVAHIYQRFVAEADREAVLTELRQLRARILAGENFEQLAQEHSHSESRHQGGLLGAVARGKFTEDFDRVVFALEEGMPSEPVSTTDGAHLFLVKSITEARSFQLEDVAGSIRQRLQEARQQEKLVRAAAALPQPEQVMIPSPQELQQILRLGDPNAVILQVGEFVLTSSQFQTLLEKERRLRGIKATPNLYLELLGNIHSREVIYQYLQGQGLEETPTPTLYAERAKELVDFFAQRKMISWAERQADLVQKHYDNNQMRFASPLKVHLRLLSIPIDGGGQAMMARLEAASPKLDAGQLKLEDLATAHSGAVKDLGFVSTAQIQAIAPQALRFVFLLQPGQHTPPFTRGKALRVFQVVERQDPSPRPLALVRDKVVQDYLTHYSAEVFEQLSDQWLEEAEYRVYEDRLANLNLGQPLDGGPS